MKKLEMCKRFKWVEGCEIPYVQKNGNMKNKLQIVCESGKIYKLNDMPKHSRRFFSFQNDFQSWSTERRGKKDDKVEEFNMDA